VEFPAEAERLMALGDDAFAAAIEREFAPFCGRVTAVSARQAFPLSALAVGSYARNRVALVGEAAHVVPPIGAQGLNLGFRDAAHLADCAGAAHQAGEDLGGDAVIRAYNAARRGDVWTRTLAADVLNRTLIAGFAPFDLGRAAGLSALAASAGLRRFAMRRGMGVLSPTSTS
jgi:2-octaprenyl-6-methoxyphenol hydroxylase